MRAFLAMMLTFGKGTAPPTVLMKSALIRRTSLPITSVLMTRLRKFDGGFVVVGDAKIFELKIFRFSAHVALEVRLVASRMMAHWVHTIFWRSNCDLPPIFRPMRLPFCVYFDVTTDLCAYVGHRSSCRMLPSRLLFLFSVCWRQRCLHSVRPGGAYFTCCGSFRGGSCVETFHEKQQGHDQFSRRGFYFADWYRQERPVPRVLSLPPMGPCVAGGRFFDFLGVLFISMVMPDLLSSKFSSTSWRSSLPRREAAS